jgi:arsenite-transporting ATPase
VGSIEHLEVSRIDPRVETARYRQHVLDTKGENLDDRGRAMLEEDLRSPCTQEIAVFQAFSRIIREASQKFVVMDTAPTGHTLLLLDTTGAYHREVIRHAEPNVRFITPMMRLQDPKRTKVIIVTLAETTPVLEAANLQEDLRRAGIEPWAWLINNSLTAATTSSPLLQQRAALELEQIDAVKTRYAQRFALVPMQVEEPVGIQALLNLVRQKHGVEAVQHLSPLEVNRQI